PLPARDAGEPAAAAERRPRAGAEHAGAPSGALRAGGRIVADPCRRTGPSRPLRGGAGGGRRARRQRYDRDGRVRQRRTQAPVDAVRAIGGTLSAWIRPPTIRGGRGAPVTTVISDADVEHVARLARLALTEAERSHMREQLDGILAYIDTLRAEDTR